MNVFQHQVTKENNIEQSAAFNDHQKLKIFWEKFFLMIRKKLPS